MVSLACWTGRTHFWYPLKRFLNRESSSSASDTKSSSAGNTHAEFGSEQALAGHMGDPPTFLFLTPLSLSGSRCGAHKGEGGVRLDAGYPRYPRPSIGCKATLRCGGCSAQGPTSPHTNTHATNPRLAAGHGPTRAPTQSSLWPLQGTQSSPG